MGKWYYRIKIDIVAVGQLVAAVTISYTDGFQRHIQLEEFLYKFVM